MYISGINRRGIFFSTDALIALVVVFALVILFLPFYSFEMPMTSIHYDLLDGFSSLKIGEIDNNYVKQLISSGKITDVNKTVIEQIGEFYSSNIDDAKALTHELISNINSSENIGIWYGDDLLASINDTSYESASKVTVARQTISGVQKGNVSKGYVAKSWLSKISGKTTTLIVRGDLMCGGWRTNSGGTEYCGTVATNISYSFVVPANSTVKEALWLFEPSWVNQPQSLYINGVRVFSGTLQYYRVVNITNYVVVGNNTALAVSTQGGDDGASHIQVDFNTSIVQTYSLSNLTYFNEVRAKSVLYHEKSILITQPVSSMNVTLNVSRITTFQIRVGNKTVTIGTKTPVNGFVNFNNAEISAALTSSGNSYNSLSGKYIFLIARVGVDASGNNVFIGKNSYADIRYSSEVVIPFGSIDFTKVLPVTSYSSNLQSDFYRNLIWSFNLPVNSIPIVADWQLGWLSTSSGSTNSQSASANGYSLYQSPPNPYISAFSRFGYSPISGNNLLRNGTNNFTLQFGSNYGVSIGSSYGSLLYFVKSFVNYGDPKQKAVGGNRTISFEDGTSLKITIGNAADPWDPSLDAIDDAVDRLLSQLDSDSNNKIDVKLDQGNFQFESLDISNVPFLWSTEVQIRAWR
jgi:hypothetical protein